MLKNSLYLGHYFPVYLFSGQRGCGKTTAARIFAAALNCEKLPVFQKNPQQQLVPCRACASCLAMRAGNHPDFIEIDAASHTGVDNVRQIIESSAFLPVMGGKKVYLIDEAHMLSRAAFNAFLKLLEEPPASVLFILATTDAHKIIPTVLSRCFQLFFKPVEEQYLVAHLQAICQQERIRCENAGLELIARETQGSVRDALNMLEQVRFSSSVVTQQAVLQVLGHLDDGQLLGILHAVITGSAADVVRSLHDRTIEQYSADFVWQRVVAAIRALMWLKYGVDPDQFTEYIMPLRALAQQCTVRQLQQMLTILYHHETPFLKTTAQHTLIELVLLQCNQLNKSRSDSEGGAAPAIQHHTTSLSEPLVDADDDMDDDAQDDDQDDDEEDNEDALMALWHTFVRGVNEIHEPLVASVFKQGTVHSLDLPTNTITVEFPQALTFFGDKIEATRPQWLPLLSGTFKSSVQLRYLFTKVDTAAQVPARVHASVTPPSKPVQKAAPAYQSHSSKNSASPYSNNFKRTVAPTAPSLLGPHVDVSDTHQWPKAQLLLRYFPGSITEITQIGSN
jgi:DNA polymerase-3 subunit gamma/tau